MQPFVIFQMNIGLKSLTTPTYLCVDESTHVNPSVPHNYIGVAGLVDAIFTFKKIMWWNKVYNCFNDIHNFVLN